MTEPEALVVAAAIGGLAALVGALVAGGTPLRNETRRRLAGRKDVERQALRLPSSSLERARPASRHMPFIVGVCLLHRGREILFPGTNGIGARREPSRAAWTPNVMTGPGPLSPRAGGADHRHQPRNRLPRRRHRYRHRSPAVSGGRLHSARG